MANNLKLITTEIFVVIKEKIFNEQHKNNIAYTRSTK